MTSVRTSYEVVAEAADPYDVPQGKDGEVVHNDRVRGCAHGGCCSILLG